MTLVVWALATLALDGSSKRVSTGMLAEGRLYAAAPSYGVRLVYNRRASLSIRETAALLAVTLVGVLAVGPHGLIATGLGIAMGGAAGNLADRVQQGSVVDFIALGPWPVFNLADAAMTVGLTLAAVSVL